MTDFCFITHQVLSFDERMMVSFAFFRKAENSGYECPELLIGFRGFELYCLCGTIHNTGIASVTMMVPNWTFIQNAIDKLRILKYLGKISKEQMSAVEDAAMESLGMPIPECVEAP